MLQVASFLKNAFTLVLVCFPLRRTCSWTHTAKKFGRKFIFLALPLLKEPANVPDANASREATTLSYY